MAQDYKNSSRAAAALIFWMAALSVLLIRTAQLQILEGARYKNYARQNRVRKVAIPAARGLIFSRDSVIIAESKPAFNLVDFTTLVEAQGREGVGGEMKAQAMLKLKV